MTLDHFPSPHTDDNGFKKKSKVDDRVEPLRFNYHEEKLQQKMKWEKNINSNVKERASKKTAEMNDVYT